MQAAVCVCVRVFIMSLCGYVDVYTSAYAYVVVAFVVRVCAHRIFTPALNVDFRFW